MALSTHGGGGAAAPKQLRVLLPSSRDRLRIPDELAEEIGAGEALVVGPGGGKGRAVWRVDLGRDAGGAFLGRGWPEFAAAHGVDAGWRLVLRHRGRGVLTVKAFDPSCCFRDLGAQQHAAAVQESVRGDTDCKPQFICMLSPDSIKKMLIPAKFVQYYITKGDLNNRMAIVFGPLGKVNNVKLEMDQSDVFFAGGWPQFLAFHDITEFNALLLRYEGNMVFTVKVFEPDGCQRKLNHKDNIMQQNERGIISTPPDLEKQHEALSVPIWKGKSQSQTQTDLPCSEVHKSEGFMPSLNEASLQRNSFYKIGQPSWIKKQIDTDTLENHLALPIAFCDAIGLHKPSMITFKTTTTGSWQVRGVPCDKQNYILVHGWRRFCEENNVKEGDICTFNVIKTTMWHVVITRLDVAKLPGTALASISKCKSSDDGSICEGQEMSKSSITSSNMAPSQKKCVYEIGPPSWIKKKILSTNSRYFTLPVAFCDAIGLCDACTITLKTSPSSTRSWEVNALPYKHATNLGLGWKKFCQDNKIKEGDICTFNIIETTLWHVAIAHR